MKRTHAAFSAGMAKGAERQTLDPAALPTGGNWSKMAFDNMAKTLEEAKGALERAEEATYQGILEGVVPVVIPADRIVDELGSDRLDPRGGEETEDYAALADNIRQRGQRVPIRVRPQDPDWRPDPRHPRDTEGCTFMLQSGRRRLAVCRDIGLDPIAFLSFTKTENAEIEDLHERFFENATRKNLTAVEKLYSMGLIASKTPDLHQAQIAEILGTSPAQISRGLAVVEFFERLNHDLDITHATRDEIDTAIKRYREEDRTEAPSAARKRDYRSRIRAALPFRQRQLKQGEAKLRIDGQGRRVLSLCHANLDDSTIEDLIALIDRDGS
mgnify:CR=1 FL=1